MTAATCPTRNDDTLQGEMRELDSRHVDTDSGRYDVALLWEERRNLLYLVATKDSEEAARIRVAGDEGMKALRHPMVYLRGHI